MPEDIRAALLRAAEEALEAFGPISAHPLGPASRCADVLQQFHVYVEGLPASHTRNEVSEALNWAAEAADEITSVVPEGDEITDVISLVVSLAAEHLDGAATIAEAVSEAYGGRDIQQWHGWVVPGWPADGKGTARD